MDTQADDKGAVRGERAPGRARAHVRRRSSREAGFRCLPSKLRPPRAHVELVLREALIARLLKSTEPLVLVSAPAGSGKTVTLTQWLAVEDRPAAWLRLDGNDNDPLLFLRCLVAALDRILAIDAEVLELLQLRDPPLASRVLPGLGAAVAVARPFVLVLDDAQLVDKPEAWAHVQLVLENLPEGAQVAIATRHDPPLPLGKMRAGGELLELRLDELAFDGGEAATLLRMHGAGQTAADDGQVDVAEEAETRAAVAALLEATEGWATGLYLAAQTAHGRSPGEWLPEVRGDQRAVADYLLGEVLERQPEELQRFLRETAILDELTAPVCAAVTGRADAGAVLSRLARENLFVSALDERDERFRYHHLFAELLRSRLERLQPEGLDDLHRRAAAWYETHDEAEPAIRHYLAAGDVAATASLTPAVLETLQNDGLDESTRRILSLYSEEQLLGYPDLAIQAGWYFLIAGETREEVQHWSRLMTHYRFEDGPTVTNAASLRSSWLILMGNCGVRGLGQERRDLEEALLIETEPGDWRDTARQGLAECHYFAGSPERAEREFRELLRERSFAGTTMADDFSTWNLAMLAHIAADAGRWDEVRDLVADIERRRPSMGLDDRPNPHWLPHLSARLRLLSHQGDAQTVAFARVIDVFTRDMVHFPSLPHVMTYTILGEVALEQSDLMLARGWCDRALRTLVEYPDAGALGRRAKQLADALGRRVMAEPLTPAERRILELLPMHMTVAHIADRLFLAKSTAKTHLRAIYRKLEVGTREEAVERARELGLLGR